MDILRKPMRILEKSMGIFVKSIGILRNPIGILRKSRRIIRSSIEILRNSLGIRWNFLGNQKAALVVHVLHVFCLPRGELEGPGAFWPQVGIVRVSFCQRCGVEEFYC